MFGWSEANVKLWYIVGALLGGFSLAQGSVYLLINKKFADISSIAIVSLILLTSFAIFRGKYEYNNQQLKL